MHRVENIEYWEHPGGASMKLCYVPDEIHLPNVTMEQVEKVKSALQAKHDIRFGLVNGRTAILDSGRVTPRREAALQHGDEIVTRPDNEERFLKEVKVIEVV